MDKRDYYEVLGVARNADKDQINAASKILPLLAQLRQEAGAEEDRDDEAADWWAVMDEDE